jgi:hypothetical protein
LAIKLLPKSYSHRNPKDVRDFGNTEQMKLRHYKVSDQIEIGAAIERVYTIAADPEILPSYAAEIAKIELVERLNERQALVRSHLRLGRLTFAYLYRYRYRPPTHYSGMQEGGGLLRGYFSFSLQARGSRTVISHSEGMLSPIPGLARLVGFIYFRVLHRGGLQEELGKLKNLVESRGAQ